MHFFGQKVRITIAHEMEMMMNTWLFFGAWQGWTFIVAIFNLVALNQCFSEKVCFQQLGLKKK